MAELVEEEEELQEEEFVSLQVAQNLSCVVTTCTVEPMEVVVILELDAATKPKDIRMQQHSRTRWEETLRTVLLETLPRHLDGVLLLHPHDKGERR